MAKVVENPKGNKGTRGKLRGSKKSQELHPDKPRAEGTKKPSKPQLPIPGLARRSDGKILLSTAYLVGANLSGRERWSGVVLTDAEASEANKRVSDSSDDAASHVAARIRWKRSKRAKNEKPRSGGDGRG